ncbi:MAG: hypothetical protein A2900_00950 [Candidatus Chisholmbacteria bacterium RIFCSPLOWO2_01_FULL_50_28]|uniref:Uncharacterized protein n=1 Tax=Candidatus Chisholmbacteria bacterium RIFCSPHIGHO2_01_FULL_52_32 TaxID=1797591 RepID=A0A1G1VUK8_9BACT|nr:MAG: hypothetical protein A2786_06010 [Candidatus Chisholmbacteria bacterium RIFCSPHIGHO2_01_FULL_52_32]OGY19657.1 MAG: hypothetical protein A2900_00950 [Candidatus Chisholmbacteria bacterium RIFCSPLOWO2_01_FULL_50_28]
MEQHPVPQQISAYHFRLVGDMTIKQFVELAGGIVVGWVIYSLPVHAILRWPLVIFSVFVGIALAFLPFEERPLDRWFFAFIKAIYSPTQLLWRKAPIVPAFFEEIQVSAPSAAEERSGADKTRLQEYLETLPAQGPMTNIDKKELHFVSDIMKLYLEVQPTTIQAVRPARPILEEERVPKVAVRKLKTPPLDPRAIMRGEIIMPKRTSGKPRKIQIPKFEPIEVDKFAGVLPTPPSPISPQETPALDLGGISPAATIRPKQPQRPSVQASVRPDLPIPTPPTEPNVLVGMVVDREGNILDNTIVTIRTKEGNIARAQKTNKIGQFFIITPLENGTYAVEVEREGFTFDIIKIELIGKPVPPIDIRAK